MEQDIFVNSTNIVYELHPCYEVVNFSYVFASFPSIQCVLIYISLGLFSFVTVCGNVLVIISVVYFKQLHTPTNFLVLSLAVTDLLVGLVLFPFYLTFSVTLCVYSAHWICQLRDCMDYIVAGSSILHLCCISIDRYYAVCKPLTYSAKINNRVAEVIILVCWSTAIIVGIIIVTAKFNHGKCEGDCAIDAVLGNIMALIMIFYLPALIMIIIYLKIFLVAQKQARSIQNTKSGANTRKMERKATKTLAIVLGVFLLCMTPYFICVLSELLSNEVVPLAVIEALIWLTLSNSMLNPFIYGFFYSWFRSAFKMIITGKIFQGDFTSAKLL